ncbi:MAG: hypothetical protein AAF383_06575 [Cyanobacteria bacterium P01_A01_bin.83]
MICRRLPLIIICSVLSAIVSSSSLATESNLDALAQEQSTNIIGSQWGLQSFQTNDSVTSEIKEGTVSTRYQTVSQLPTENSTENSGKSVAVESLVEINKPLFIIAMAVTSTISVFLLWILFRKPVSGSEIVAELPTDSEAKISPENEPEAREKSKISSVSDEVNASPVVLRRGLSDSLIKEESRSEKALNQDLLDGQTDEQSTVEKLSPSRSLVRINESEDYIDVVFELTKDLQSSDRNVRRKAIWELAKLGDSRVIAPLMAIMPQANSVDKSLVVKAVTQITKRSFKPVNVKLLKMLDDDNPQVRVNAILDLAAFYKFVAPVTQQLCKMQLDSDPQVRQTASRVLQNLNLNYPVSMTSDYAKNQVSDLAVGKKNQVNKR